MKTLLRIFILVFIVYPNFIVAQTWSWVLPATLISDQVTTPQGITYLTGTFNNMTLPNLGVAGDYIVLEIDSSGIITGGITKTEADLSEGHHIGFDDAGYLYVFGKPLSPSAYNYHLKKLSKEGELIWSRRIKLNNSAGAGGMDVKNGRIALIGNTYHSYAVARLNEPDWEANIGYNCDPDWDDDCPNTNNIFVCSFSTDGTLNFAQLFGSPPNLGEENDWGKDISILPDNNIAFVADFWYYSNSIIGNLKTNGDGPHLIKIDSLGQPLWLKSIPHNINNPEDDNYTIKLSGDAIGNTYVVIAEELTDACNYVIHKYNAYGKLLWSSKTTTQPFYYEYDPGFSMHTTSVGETYVFGDYYIKDENQNVTKRNLITKTDTDGKLKWTTASAVQGLAKGIYADNDGNLYVASNNALEKYIVRDPHHFTFTGSGSWKNTTNWEGENVPPYILPKWDSISIATHSGDSCVLDTTQYLSEGSVLHVLTESKLIITGNVETGTPPNPTTAISGLVSIAPLNVIRGNKIQITCIVQPGYQPQSSGIQVSANLSVLGGNESMPLLDNGTLGDGLAGDNIFSAIYDIPLNATLKSYNIPVQISDAQNRLYHDTLKVTVAPVIGGDVVISQVYGGGGITGATYKNDFVVLFNRGNQPVNISGWSLQFAGTAGTEMFGDHPPIGLNGTLQPGQYYLIQLHEGANGANIPMMADATGTLDIPNNSGKLALVNTTLPLGCNGSFSGSGKCSIEQKEKMMDLVVFGSAYFYNIANAPALVNGTTSLQRYWNGCSDYDDNIIESPTSRDWYINAVVPRNTQSPFNLCQSGVVISQVSGALAADFHNQFIELFNAGSKAQDLTGWSVQYADSNSASWQATTLSGVIQPGKYYLIRQGYTPNYYKTYLPQPDAIGNTLMNEQSGKVALVNTNVPLNGNCTLSETIDLVGYGNADCFEGSGTAAAGSNTTALLRKENGCQDSNDNMKDFLKSSPNPRNSAGPFSICSGYFNENFLVDGRDGKVYDTKRFGTQIWMTENLNYNQAGSVLYNNDPENEDKFGRLYKWPDGLSACPSGWHVPDYDEWATLRNFMVSGAAMRDTLFWTNPNVSATNSSGFSARPGGYRYEEEFKLKGEAGLWWTSTWFDNSADIDWRGLGYGYKIDANTTDFTLDAYFLMQLSIRCIKN